MKFLLHLNTKWEDSERKSDILYPLLDCNSLPSARSISFLLEMEAASSFHGNLVVGGLQAP